MPWSVLVVCIVRGVPDHMEPLSYTVTPIIGTGTKGDPVRVRKFRRPNATARARSKHD